MGRWSVNTAQFWDALGQEEDHEQTKVGSDLQIRGLVSEWLWKETLPVRASWCNDRLSMRFHLGDDDQYGARRNS